MISGVRRFPEPWNCGARNETSQLRRWWALEVTDARSVVDACFSGGSHHCRWRSFCAGSAGAGHGKGWQGASHVGQDLLLVHDRRCLYRTGHGILPADSLPRAGSRLQLLCGILGLPVLGQKAAWKGASVARPLDWAAAIFCFAASLTLAVLGAIRPELVQNLRIPAIVFGLVGMRISGRSMWRFTHPPAEKMFWWYAHLQG